MFIKLMAVMKWREEKAIGLPDMLTLAEVSSTSTEAVEDPDQYAKAKALATSMNYASMYWHGVDKKGRPILWIRTDRMVSFLPLSLVFHAFVNTSFCSCLSLRVLNSHILHIK